MKVWFSQTKASLLKQVYVKDLKEESEKQERRQRDHGNLNEKPLSNK